MRARLRGFRWPKRVRPAGRLTLKMYGLRNYNETMGYRSVACIAAALLVAAGVAAQTPPRKRPVSTSPKPAAQGSPAKQKYPVAAIVIKGNKTLTAEQIIKASGLKVGELADKPRFDEARKQLESTGMLDSIAYQFEPAESRSEEKTSEL